MKLNYLIICLAFTNAFSQWKNATPLGSSINDIQFTNRYTGYALATAAQIGNCSNTAPLNLYKTVDGGENWILTNTGGSANSAIFFIDDLNGWIAGVNTSQVYGTTNGGQTWTSLANTIAGGVNDIYFTSLQNGFIIGNGGALRKTNNGGTTWQTISAGGVTANLNKIYFYNSQLGFITCQNGQLLRTTNGGANWTSVSTGSSSLRDVHFTSASVGYATGYVTNGYSVLKTTNGGVSWNVLQQLTVGGYPLNKITFTNANNGFIVSAGKGIFITHDAGNTWTQSYTLNGENDNFNSIYFIDNNIGFICGTGGKIYKTTNAGNTWRNCTSAASGAFYSVWATNKKTAYAGGYAGSILKTDNGGLNWKLKSKSLPAASTINKIYFVNDSIGFAASDTGRILKTIDAGETWIQKPTNSARGISDFSFINKDTGYASADGGIIFRTFDNGETWDSIATTSTDYFTGIFFTNFDTGFAISYSKIHRTFNAGITWSITNLSLQNIGDLNDIVFTNDSLGYCGGGFGKLLFTTDAGLNWYPTNSMTNNAEIEEISAVNDSVLYFARYTSQHFTLDSGKVIGSQSTACLQNNWSMKGISMTNNGATGYCTGGLGNSLVHIKEQLEIETIVGTNSYCAGSKMPVACIGRGFFASGCIMNLELSDATGSFANPIIIGSYTPTSIFVYQSGVVTATIPANTPSGLYRVRAVSTNPIVIGSDNGFDIAIQAQAIPTVSLQSNIVGNACPNSPFVFNVNTFAGGLNPTFQWFLNGIDINNNSSIYNTDSLQDNDMVNVIMTSSLSCVANSSASSNSFTANVVNFTISTSSDDTICQNSNTQITVVGGISYLWSPPNGLNNSSINNPIASPNQTTSYNVLVTDINGCTATDHVNIIVNPTPINSIVNNDTNYCGAATVQLNAVGGNQYSWFPTSGLNNNTIANPMANIATTTNYLVQVTNAFGCSAIDSVKFTINALPTNIIATNNSNYCGSGTIQLQANGGVQYSWLPTTGLNNPNISNPIATINGSIQYQVLVTDVNGCTNSDTLQINQQNPITLPIIQMVNTSVCPNSNLFLVAYNQPYYTYLWTSSTTAIPFPTISTSPIDSIASTTTFYLTVVDTNTTCSKTDSVTISVFNSQIQMPIISENNGVLTCTPADFYQWYLDTVPITLGVQQSYTPTSEGVYSVAVYDSLACNYYTSSTYYFIFTDTKTSINYNRIHVFPNPAKSSISISGILKQNLTIQDCIGKIIFEKNNCSHLENIDLSEFSKGLYFIKTKGQTTKFIIE